MSTETDRLELVTLVPDAHPEIAQGLVYGVRSDGRPRYDSAVLSENHCLDSLTAKELCLKIRDATTF
jgi:hypothetical protein